MDTQTSTAESAVLEQIIWRIRVNDWISSHKDEIIKSLVEGDLSPEIEDVLKNTPYVLNELENSLALPDTGNLTQFLKNYRQTYYT